MKTQKIPEWDNSADLNQREYEEFQHRVRETDKLRKEYGINPEVRSNFFPMIGDSIRRGSIRAARCGKTGRFLSVGLFGGKVQLTELDLFGAGWRMENVEMAVEMVNKELEKSSETLKGLVNQVKEMSEPLEKQLLDILKNIRAEKMAIVSEVESVLHKMKEVRKFFLEQDYEKEMERLERFIKVCNEIKRLKEEKVFDAIIDSAITLAIQDKGEKR